MSKPYDLTTCNDIRLGELHKSRPDLRRAIEEEWAEREHAEEYRREQEEEYRTVSREMALDAGDPSLEGTRY